MVMTWTKVINSRTKTACVVYSKRAPDVPCCRKSVSTSGMCTLMPIGTKSRQATRAGGLHEGTECGIPESCAAGARQAIHGPLGSTPESRDARARQAIHGPLGSSRTRELLRCGRSASHGQRDPRAEVDFRAGEQSKSFGLCEKMFGGTP